MISFGAQVYACGSQGACIAGRGLETRTDHVEGYTLPRPSMSECVKSGTGTGLQAGQGLLGAARGRPTRHSRHPTDDEHSRASWDASAVPRQPRGVAW